MAADTLAPCVARSSAAGNEHYCLTMYDKTDTKKTFSSFN